MKEALPDAIIIDLFHITRTANQVMDKVRNRLFSIVKNNREPGQPGGPRPETSRKPRTSLTEYDPEYMEYWFDKQPELRLAYELKENFLEIFDGEFTPAT